MGSRSARHVVIGAGITGTVLAGHLGGDVVVLDPEPHRYKVGESVIPEQFFDPRMAAHLDAVRALPSWSPKGGTLFVGGSEVSFFPLAQHQLRSMHVFRQELEALLRQRLGVRVTREKVLSVEGRVVHTDAGTWTSEGPVLDCSGPAMVIASSRDEVQDLWPVWASWAYHDVSSFDPSGFWSPDRAWQATTLDVPSGRLMTIEPGRQDPTQLTALVRINDGLWMWQIPLYARRVLSVGVVSRHGEVDEHTYDELVRQHVLPCWTTRPRYRHGPSWAPQSGLLPAETSSFHQRGGFARKAQRAATEEYVLLGDAFAFADPVYSVGTGLAVSQALQLCDLLNSQPWSAKVAASFHEHAEAAFLSATEAFQFWYDGTVLRDERVAALVQKGFLSGESFRGAAFGAYAHVIGDAMKSVADGLTAALREVTDGLQDGPWEIEVDPRESAVLLRGGSHRLEVARASAGLHWKRFGALGLSYRGASPPGVALAEQLGAALVAHESRWLEAIARVESLHDRG